MKLGGDTHGDTTPQCLFAEGLDQNRIGEVTGLVFPVFDEVSEVLNGDFDSGGLDFNDARTQIWRNNDGGHGVYYNGDSL